MEWILTNEIFYIVDPWRCDDLPDPDVDPEKDPEPEPDPDADPADCPTFDRYDPPDTDPWVCVQLIYWSKYILYKFNTL